MMLKFSLFAIGAYILLGLIACGSGAERSELPRILNNSQTTLVSPGERGLTFAPSQRVVLDLATTSTSIGTSVLAPSCIGFLPPDFTVGYITCLDSEERFVLQVKNVEQRCNVPGEEFVVNATEPLPAVSCDQPALEQFTFDPPLTLRVVGR